MTEAVPGLEKASAEFYGLVDRFSEVRTEGEVCTVRISTAVSRIEQMQASALAGRPVDLIEFNILQTMVRSAEARRAELLSQIEGISAQMDAILKKLDADVATALQRHAAIQRAEQMPGGHA